MYAIDVFFQWSICGEIVRNSIGSLKKKTRPRQCTNKDILKQMSRLPYKSLDKHDKYFSDKSNR